MLSYLFLAAFWSPAGKGLTSWLSCVFFFFFCHFPKCAFIHIRTTVEVGTIKLNIFKLSGDFFTVHSKKLLLLWILFVFMFHNCLLYWLVCSLQPCAVFASKGYPFKNIFVITCWERADLLAFLFCCFDVFLCFCHSPISYGVSGQLWYLIVLTPDLCLLLNF